MTTDVEIDQKQEKGVEWLMAACVRGVLVTLRGGVGGASGFVIGSSH